MQREPFDSRVIESAGDDPARCTHEGEFRNHRIYHDLDVPPAEWLALADAASAGAHFSAHIHNAYECWRLVNRARATHPQAAPL
jgi:hypothetical protein